MSNRSSREFAEKIKKIDDIMVDVGSRLFEINMLLDSAIKDLLNACESDGIEIDMTFPFVNGTTHEILTAERIFNEPVSDQLRIDVRERSGGVAWVELSASAKDMLANAAVLKLAADNIFIDLKKH